MKTYKLVRIYKKDGSLHPLFIEKSTAMPLGEKLEHVVGKSGGLSLRAGWHSLPLPYAHHIGEKKNPSDVRPSFRSDNQVWVECEIEGTEIPKANIPKYGFKDVPKGSYYQYLTQANASQVSFISSSITLIRVLSDTEVEKINREAGVCDLPRR